MKDSETILRADRAPGEDESEKTSLKHLKKRKTIILQVALLVFIIFLVLILNSVHTLITGNRKAYFRGKEEMLDRLLFEMEEKSAYIPASEWALTYVSEHVDEINSLKLTTEQLYPYLHDSSGYYADGYIVPDIDEIRKMSGEEQLLTAKAIYAFLGWELGEAQNLDGEEQYFCMDIRPGKEGLLYIDSANMREDEDKFISPIAGTHREELTPSEETIEYFRTTPVEDLASKYEERVDSRGRHLLIGYDPYLMSEPDGMKAYTICVVGIVHDWSEYYGTMADYVFRRTTVLVVEMLLAELILLLYLYRRVLRPMKQIQTGVREYTQNKDCGRITDHMGEVRQKNEVGALAEDISGMAREIERYTKENLQIAQDRERVGTELVLATKFQRDMLPKDFPDHSRFEISALMQPAKEVGGDFYDYFMQDENHFAFLIADVSDKGMSAAFFMAITKTLINSRTRKGGSPVEILGDVDRWLEDNNSLGQFVTVWMGILDLESGELSICNAGHDYPAMALKGGDYTIEPAEHGHPVAFFPGMQLVQKGYTLQLSPGDRIFLYTDGVLDELGEDGERFEKKRLLSVLNAHKDAENKDLVQIVLREVIGFGGTEGQFDDITMVSIIYKG